MCHFSKDRKSIKKEKKEHLNICMRAKTHTRTNDTHAHTQSHTHAQTQTQTHTQRYI